MKNSDAPVDGFAAGVTHTTTAATKHSTLKTDCAEFERQLKALRMRLWQRQTSFNAAFISAVVARRLPLRRQSSVLSGTLPTQHKGAESTIFLRTQ